LFRNDQLDPLYASRYLYLWGNLYYEIFTVVDDKIDSLNIDSSSEEVGGDEKSWTIRLEEIIVFDSFFLFELRVNADRIEEFLS
jgi:hypothetical protein